LCVYPLLRLRAQLVGLARKSNLIINRIFMTVNAQCIVGINSSQRKEKGICMYKGWRVSVLSSLPTYIFFKTLKLWN
jgi:hypothetical protein